METVVPPPADSELHLLTEWGDPDSSARRKKAVMATVLLHLALIGGLVAVPPMIPEAAEKPQPKPHVTILEPLTQLTQKAPNTGKINKEFEAKLELPRAATHAPVAPPPQPKAQAPRPAVIPPAPAPRAATPAPALPEPPKLETATKEPPKPELPGVVQAPVPAPPQIQPVEKPKLALENVGEGAPAPPPGRGRIPIPSSSVTSAVHDLTHASGGALIVGDSGASSSDYGSITQRPAPGVPLSNLQLLSDEQGVDFKPYLIQILATVKRNWLAVMPESVRLGRHGKVSIQFSIAKNGNVLKLVFASNSGADALDRAAVAGISASSPFPPLPGEFRGDRIVLQMNFVYR